ncbi:MAG: hypothetical protein RLY93_05485 [Sumerlaeia bacterium]
MERDGKGHLAEFCKTLQNPIDFEGFFNRFHKTQSVALFRFTGLSAGIVADYGSEGREFESLWACHLNQAITAIIENEYKRQLSHVPGGLAIDRAGA